jgi:hypothetical protein
VARSEALAMYERAALILDSETHALGDLSLALITLGLRPLYTTDLDELVLLSREYRAQVGAVLLPAALLTSTLPRLRKRILEPLGLPLAAVVPIGERLPPEVCEPLRCEGMRFCLPAPYEPHELRFVVARTLSDTDPEELRLDPRAPCDIPVAVESEHRRFEGRLRDFSMTGAFVAVENPHQERALVTLHFPLRDEECRLSARVAWCTGASSPPWCDRGMGVEFLPADDATRALLRRSVAEKFHRFRL